MRTVVDESPQVRVPCYLHTSQYAPQGWYAKAERTVLLSRPWRWSSPAYERRTAECLQPPRMRCSGFRQPLTPGVRRRGTLGIQKRGAGPRPSGR
jgi:hypothetical protein